MATATDIAPTARLKTRYLEEIRPALVERFGYTSVMQAPKLEKITVNMGVGLAKQDSKVLKAATEQLAAIAGQQPSVRRARKSIAAFKLREGMPVGLAVTLRAERSYEFLDRLISVAIPRIRDFRGLNARSFDGRGNYSLGVKEQIIFPEIDYDAIDSVRGLDITITTSAATDIEAYALLAAFGMPFSPDRRPKGYDPDADAAAERAHEQAEIERAAAEATAEADAQKAAEVKAAAAEAKAAKAAAGKADKRAPKAAEAEPQAAVEPESAPAPEVATAEPEVAAAAEPEVAAAAEPEVAAAEPEAEAEVVEEAEEAVAEEAEEAVAEEAAAEAAIVAEAESETAAEPGSETEASAGPGETAATEESDAPNHADGQTTEKESTD
jgi:large subunit ribosomal protein L5